MSEVIPFETAKEIKRLKAVIEALNNNIKTLNKKVFEHYPKMTKEKLEAVEKLKTKFRQDIADVTIQIDKLIDSIKPRKIESMYHHFIKLLEPHFPNAAIETKAYSNDFNFYSFSIGGRDQQNNRFGVHIGSHRDQENLNIYKLNIVIGKEIQKEGHHDKKDVTVDMGEITFPEFAERLANTVKSMLENLTNDA